MDPRSQLDATGREHFLARVLKGLWNGGLRAFGPGLPRCAVCRERVALVKDDGETAESPLCQLCFEMMLKTAALEIGTDRKFSEESVNDSTSIWHSCSR